MQSVCVYGARRQARRENAPFVQVGVHVDDLGSFVLLDVVPWRWVVLGPDD